MESSKEQIEAQLCAYIDGELNDGERAEIERHLASNPQHQSLIAELRRHSGLLQDLPRASAPLELNEALCGQLERSALLNASEEGESTGLSINRWPQITAVAAVLILAIGLGIVVYYVLPPSGAGTRGPVALDPTKPHQPTTDGVIADRDRALTKQAGKPEGVEPKGVALGKRSAMDTATLNVQPEFDPAPTRAGEIKDGRLITATEVEALRRRANLSLQAGNPVFNLDNSSLCLVVSASDTATANHQVAAFFESNQIRYMKYDDSVSALESEVPLTASRGGASITPSKINGPADDHLKDTYANRGNLAEPSAPTPSGTFGGGGGGGAAAGGAGGNSRGGGVQQAGQGDDARSDVKTSEQALREEAAAKAKVETVPSRGMPAQAPGAVASNGTAAAKPGALGDSVKAPAEHEAKIEYRDKDTATFNKADSEKDKAYGAGREKDAAKKLASGFGDATAEKQPATEASRQTWELKDRDARARIAAQIADNPVERNGVIIARMNRRQANQLQAMLSHEQGQRAELSTVNLADATQPNLAYSKESAGNSLGVPAAGTGAVLDSNLDSKNKVRAPLAKGSASMDALAAADPASAGNEPKVSEPKPAEKVDQSHGLRTFGMAPTTHPAEDGIKLTKEAQASKNEASEALRLQTDPLDAPVDVFIVVKGEGTSGAQIELSTPKAGVDGAPVKEKK